jgi:hypothetical protein
MKNGTSRVLENEEPEREKERLELETVLSS